MKWILLFLLLPLTTLSQCILDDNVTVDVPPIGGVYQPGQVLTFTYTINDYQGLSTNWLHGISLILGSGYDVATLAPFGLPTNNSAFGQWLWVNSITSSLSGFTVNNPGWFYDNGLGGPVFLDGDPGNNWGDGMLGPWTFQWTVTVGQCPPNIDGDDLSIIIENWADGETGSWINFDCQNDPNEVFNATIECCPIVITGLITHN